MVDLAKKFYVKSRAFLPLPISILPQTASCCLADFDSSHTFLMRFLIILVAINWQISILKINRDRYKKMDQPKLRLEYQLDWVRIVDSLSIPVVLVRPHFFCNSLYRITIEIMYDFFGCRSMLYALSLILPGYFKMWNCSCT